MSGKTFIESVDELRDAVRELGAAIADTPPLRAAFRFFEYVDRRVPQLRWLDDHAPRWIRFGTDEFWDVLAAGYLIVTGLLVAKWLLSL